MKNKGNTGFRNGDLFCFNCGQSYKINYPQPVDMASVIMKQFAKSHEYCAKVWVEPVAEVNGKTEKENCDWWLQNGERGISSETMFSYLSGSGIRISKYQSTPSDPDDFRRCYLLLKAIPQFKEKLHLLKPVSETWSKLIDNWDKLTEMLETAMESKSGKASKMYDLMKSLGC